MRLPASRPSLNIVLSFLLIMVPFPLLSVAIVSSPARRLKGSPETSKRRHGPVRPSSRESRATHFPFQGSERATKGTTRCPDERDDAEQPFRLQAGGASPPWQLQQDHGTAAKTACLERSLRLLDLLERIFAGDAQLDLSALSHLAQQREQ